MTQAFHHRPTLKQSNKPFKSKHATKSSLKDAAKGKINRKSQTATPASNVAAQAKLNRRNNAKQAQAKKRTALVSATRIFNGVDGAPRIVAVVPLTPDVQCRSVIASLAESLDVPTEDLREQGLWKMKADRFKTSLQFLPVAYRDFYGALDACKVADYTVLVLSPSTEVDAWGDTLLRTLQSQGLPDIVSVIPFTEEVDSKAKQGIMKSLLSFIQYFVPSQSRIYDLHSQSDRLNALRALAEGKPDDVRWREGRAYLLGEDAAWEQGAEEEEGKGTLRVTGTVRGTSAGLSPNRLVHIPNFGDFQITKIDSAPLPLSKKHRTGGDMEIESTTLAEPNDDADSLVSSNDPDDMANEQTWPTEEDMASAPANHSNEDDTPDAQNGTTPKVVKRVPKGMSEYQASWIVDEDEDEDEEGDVVGERDEEMQEEEEEEMEDLQIDDDEEMETDGRRTVAFEDLDNEEESKQLDSWRNRKREEEDDAAFPDEIDTPQDVAARQRFQRYRGLRSFRTSPWDPYENLPRDYARIFQFEDYKRTERGVRRRAEQESGTIESGVRVTVHLKSVPQAALRNSPLVLFALLQHEHKISVQNFTVQRNTEYDGIVKSKDPLVMCVGGRRFSVNPVYSQHTRGGGRGANNVHKFERFLRHGVTSVATVYAPIGFGSLPVVFLRETKDRNAPELVGSGTFLNPDTTRIVAKKIILTGHPFKVHKKTATVRYMFFQPDDIQYFKPIQLYTKHGRSGHIKESLGTHGYFKAHFDGPINQMDTVCMALYKRVYPKWASVWQGQGSGSSPSQGDDAMEE